MGMVAYICNFSTWEAEEGGSQVQGQPGLYQVTWPQKMSVFMGINYLLFNYISTRHN
jgi:hypothetical protein